MINSGVIGSAFLVIVYGIYLILNLNSTFAEIFGSLLVVVGYYYLVIEYSKENNKTNSKVVKKTFPTGHLILALFLFLSSFLPINVHIKRSDVVAFIGHLLIVFSRNLMGSALLVIYYIIYFFRNFDLGNIINILQIIGAAFLVYFYANQTIENE